MFQRLCLAFAFSPRAEALVCEATRMAQVFNAHLTVLHVGDCTIEEKNQISALVKHNGLAENQFRVICEAGTPTKVILSICKREKIDLLIAGALQKESLLKYYLGTIGRTILRKAECSVLMLTNPKQGQLHWDNIVTMAENSPYIQETLMAACHFATASKTKWLHVVRELKMYGLTLSTAEQSSEEEYDAMRQQLVRNEIVKAEEYLQKCQYKDVKINIKVISGKSGYELTRFAERKNADLLVAGAPGRKLRLFDRLFRHDLEYIFADLPCNLLIVNPTNQSPKHG